MSDVNAAFDARFDAKLLPVLARLAALEAGGPPDDPPPPTVGPATLRMGMNLSAPSYWSPSWPFNDLMRTAHAVDGKLTWLEQPVGLLLDADGWPLSLGVGQKVLTVLVVGVGDHYPAGAYTIAWDGDGTIALLGDAVGTFSSSPASVAIAPVSGLSLRITRSVAGNPLRNLRVLLPGAVFDKPLRAGYLDQRRPFSVLRLMDWTKTNSSTQTQVAWADRPREASRTWAQAGVPWETCIDLANALDADPWLCLPHMASEDYTRQLATLVKGRLKPGLKVYLEYSNEVWNGIFPVNKWVEARSTTENIRQTYARLAVGHFKAWESSWGDRARLVRVFAGQSANVDVVRQILVAAGPGQCDAIAHAPYFGGALGSNVDVATWPVDKVLDACLADVAVQKAYMVKARALADEHGVASIAYEGGQHLAASGTLNGDTALVAKLAEANRHPRMGEVYAAYFAAWEATGGGLFVHFDDVRMPAKYGSWGAWEWFDQPETPKARAMLAAAAKWRAAP